MLPKSRFSKPIFGHSAGSTKLDRPYCKQFSILFLFCFGGGEGEEESEAKRGGPLNLEIEEGWRVFEEGRQGGAQRG